MNRVLCRLTFPLFLVVAAAVLGGCPIPQPPGQGRSLYRTCRASNQDYWLYVPINYNVERRYPLVVTLHGMKPYDVSRHHVEMWGHLADKYGYIVLAPKLVTSDTFGQFPLRKMGPAETRDVQHILACIEEVAGDWEVDRNSLLLSSWSMGGYLAHYIATEYGGRFAAFAPLQSNFCNEPLNPAKARQWASKLPLFIFYGTVDFAGVTNECKDAVAWYSRLGYKIREKSEPIGHRRHPELAAEFFEWVLAGRMKSIEIIVTPPRQDPPPLAVNLFPMLSSKIPEVRTYMWEFGRLGAPSYQKSPNLLIRQPGEYPIRLTLIDKNGQQYLAETRLVVPSPAAAERPNGPVRPN